MCVCMCVCVVIKLIAVYQSVDTYFISKFISSCSYP